LEQQVTSSNPPPPARTLRSTRSNRNAKVLRPRLDRLPDQARRIGDLERESKTAEAVFDALSRKYQEAIIARTTALSDVTITQAADRATTASRRTSR
jgi:uncharacterized protein involved in exopolysaccharide biosynthesis